MTECIQGVLIKFKLKFLHPNSIQYRIIIREYQEHLKVCKVCRGPVR